MNGRCNFKKGFSLIELLVGIAIIAIVMVITSNLFLSNLKNQNKMEAQIQVKQNGNQVLQTMSTFIRNAQSITCISSSQVTIASPDGGTTLFSCNTATCASRISSGSACLTPSTLTLSSCSFTCSSSSGKPTTVTIQFTLTKGSTTDIRNYSSQAFSTTISLRKY